LPQNLANYDFRDAVLGILARVDINWTFVPWSLHQRRCSAVHGSLDPSAVHYPPSSQGERKQRN